MSNDSAFLSAIRSRAARIAVGPSTARGQGRAGVVDASRRFLRGLDLRPFGTDDTRRFRQALDQTTRECVAALPRDAQSWGLARKLLNIFLRDCLYTTYLCDQYKLGQAEAFFELPLDSITAKELRRERGRGALPPWRGLKHLVAEISDLYQDAAARVARERGVCRVHLDAYWWSQSRDGL
jgi:hypothetical protein